MHSITHRVLCRPLHAVCLCKAGAHPTDVRMTTRFKQDDLTEGITGACLPACLPAWPYQLVCLLTACLVSGNTCLHTIGAAPSLPFELCLARPVVSPQHYHNLNMAFDLTQICGLHISGAIHETGHSLYEQGRNLEYDGLPVNQVGEPKKPRDRSLLSFVCLAGRHVLPAFRSGCLGAGSLAGHMAGCQEL
jgi:hypothetical protein